MSDLLSLVLLGFFLGMRHATDPDHVIAVTTIVARYRSWKGAGLIGAAWGLGHTLTILVVGGAIVGLGWAVPRRLELSMELAVAAMLVGLGAWNLKGLRLWWSTARAAGPSAEVHVQAHRHGDYVHTHAHVHADPASHPHRADATPLARLDRWFGTLAGYRLVRPLVIGVVHGLAGSAAAALLVLAVIGDPAWALAYLGVFGAGTIAGMMAITTALALPVSWAGGRSASMQAALRAGAGALSVVFGLFLAYQIGWTEGLFR